MYDSVNNQPQYLRGRALLETASLDHAGLDKDRSGKLQLAAMLLHTWTIDSYYCILELSQRKPLANRAPTQSDVPSNDHALIAHNSHPTNSGIADLDQ
jgi:hypothetical protein